MFAVWTDATIAAVFAGLATLVAVVIPAYIALRKAWAETAAASRTGVIAEYQAALDFQSKRIDAMEAEILGLRDANKLLHAEIDGLRGTIKVHQDELVKAVGEAKRLEGEKAGRAAKAAEVKAEIAEVKAEALAKADEIIIKAIDPIIDVAKDVKEVKSDVKTLLE